MYVGLSLRQWGLFNLVGAGGFAAQVAVIAVLTRTFGWRPLAATAVGLWVAALMNFFGHTAWTFGDHPVASARALAGRYVRYQLANFVSLGVNAAVTLVLASAAHIRVEFANIAAVLVCAVPNYLVIEKSFGGGSEKIRPSS